MCTKIIKSWFGAGSSKEKAVQAAVASAAAEQSAAIAEASKALEASSEAARIAADNEAARREAESRGRKIVRRQQRNASTDAGTGSRTGPSLAVRQLFGA
ncbi:MAG TPA: hypothetical protein PLJ34_04225 [Hyphomicrobiales bacterium]|nr:hypothetical protein [Kaistiaceae bacterium]HQF30634.1 hypothetical protein [Hyphomicrobiales bacterium]